MKKRFYFFLIAIMAITVVSCSGINSRTRVISESQINVDIQRFNERAQEMTLKFNGISDPIDPDSVCSVCSVCFDSRLNRLLWAIENIDLVAKELADSLELGNFKEFRNNYNEDCNNEKTIFIVDPVLFPGPQGFYLVIRAMYSHDSDESYELFSMREAILVEKNIDFDPDRFHDIDAMESVYGLNLWKSPIFGDDQKVFQETLILNSIKTSLYSYLYKEVKGAEVENFELRNNDNYTAGQIISDLADKGGDRNGVATPFEMLSLVLLSEEDLGILVGKYPQEINQLLGTTEKWILD